MIFYISFILYSDITKVSIIFLNLQPIFIPPILISWFLALLILSKRQQFLLEKIGVKIPFKDSFSLYFAGLSMTATPGGAGELIKAHYLKKRTGQQRSKTMPVFLIERVLDFLGISSVLVLTLFFYQLLVAEILVAISLALIFLFFLLLRNSHYLVRFFDKFQRIKIIKNIPYSSDEFLHSSALLCNKKTVFQSWVITLASNFFVVIAIFLAFLSFDIQFDYILTTQLTLTSILFGALSFLPGGIGITEASLVGLLVERNIELAYATGLVIFIRFSTIWFATILGFIFMKTVTKNGENRRNDKND